MQIQQWEELGYFRPEIYLTTNFFDHYFRIGQYILVDTVMDEYWSFRRIETRPNLDKFYVVEE